MIKQNTITINISYRNITHYIKLGYKPILNIPLEIYPNHLPSASHVIITSICEICFAERDLIYCKYLENKKRYGFYGCKKCSRQKAALTSMKKYGVDNYSRTDEWKSRVEKTNLKKFGFKTNLLNPSYQSKIKNILKNKYGTENFYEIRNVNNKNKFILDDKLDLLIKYSVKLSESEYNDDILTKEYHRYKTECRRITESCSKHLFLGWDGIDYYDGEYIKDNFDLDHNDPKYPTVDHKISISYGFNNKIDPNQIGDIKNLCVTKRNLNCLKRNLNEKEFIETLNQSSN